MTTIQNKKKLSKINIFASLALEISHFFIGPGFRSTSRSRFFKEKIGYHIKIWSKVGGLLKVPQRNLLAGIRFFGKKGDYLRSGSQFFNKYV